MLDFLIQVIAQAVLFLYPAWRISKKAGLNPAISFTVLMPIIGVFVCALAFALTKWQLLSKGGN